MRETVSKERQEELVLSKVVCLRPIDGLTGQQNRKRKWTEETRGGFLINLNLAHGSHGNASEREREESRLETDLPLLSPIVA